MTPEKAKSIARNGGGRKRFRIDRQANRSPERRILAAFLPIPARSQLAVRPNASGPENWAGASGALHWRRRIYGAWRMRNPASRQDVETRGRGRGLYAGVSRNGRDFTVLQVITKDQIPGTESKSRWGAGAQPAGSLSAICCGIKFGATTKNRSITR